MFLAYFMLSRIPWCAGLEALARAPATRSPTDERARSWSSGVLAASAAASGLKLLHAVALWQGVGPVSQQHGRSSRLQLGQL